MANDLMVKMGLNTKEFDKSLKDSAGQINNFEGKMNGLKSGFGSFAGTIAKFSGAIGAGVIAGEALGKVLTSNQTINDKWRNTIEASRSSVDAFFRSLTTGDWRTFEDGLAGTFEKFRKLSETLDSLADKKLSLSFIKEKDLTDIENFEATAKDTTKTLKERKDAAAGMQAAVDKLAQSTKSTIDSTSAAIKEMYQAQYGLAFDEKDITDFIENTNFGGSIRKQVEEYQKQLKVLEGEKYRYTQTPYGSQRVENDGAQAKIEAFKQQNLYLEKQRILLDETDDRRQNTVNMLRENLQMEKEIYTLKKRADETGRGVKPIAKEPAPTIGSKKYLEKEIADLSKAIENSDAANMPVDLLVRRDTLKKQLDDISRNEKIVVAMKIFGASGEGDKNIKAPAYGSLDSEKMKPKTLDFDAENSNLQKYNDLLKETEKQVITTNDAMNSLTSGMYSLGSAIGGNGGSWLQWGSQLIGVVSSALPALGALATAQGKVAITGAAASVAAIPVVGWVTALGAVASMIAAFASMPTFADGGVVPGSSFTGDKIMARVNSGEMILNETQQGRLWNMLNNGDAPSSGGEVVLKVRGTDLEGVLKNISYKNGRR